MTEEQSDLGKTIETDILVLGSGAAGCGAAIAAKEQGVRVALVDKGKLESSGCVGGGNDHFKAILHSGQENDTEEVFVNFFKGPTSGLTAKALSLWVRAMPPMLDVLQEVGIKFMQTPDGTWVRTSGFGEPGAWYIQIENGQLIKRRLARKIRQMGVDVFDYVMITKLLTQDNRIIGAVGYHVLDGTFYVFKARSVVLALGRGANRATTSSTNNPYNIWHHPYNTGSQFVLAYDAGARLINLDLRQLATLLPKGFGSAGMNGINAVGAHELNALGERFMGKYHPMMENGPRHRQVQGTHLELTAGKGPPFHMDMRHCDKEELRVLQYILMPGDKATFLDYAEQAGVDFAKYPMEVELSEIEFGGLVLTDDHLEATVKGLFSGCQFDSLSGAMCGGYAAAIEAVKALSSAKELSPVNLEEMRNEKERIFKPIQKMKGGIHYERFERAIRQVMMYYMGFVRNEKGIATALDRLNFIGGYLDKLQASDVHELMRANESVHLLKMCQLATRATIERKESGRTIYRRSDYPDLDPQYSKVLATWQEAGEQRLAWL
ncbi:MAG: Succinate dehydrogenase flavoprotein subunit [Deltaproteobacteria bacterium]|nr:Succinate dehydrogenase flavoprotein subunit [Deltaproteobacteria bacterium]